MLLYVNSIVKWTGIKMLDQKKNPGKTSNLSKTLDTISELKLWARLFSIFLSYKC